MEKKGEIRDAKIGDVARLSTTEDHIMDAEGIIYDFDLDDNLAAKTEDTETTEYNYSSTGELMSVALPDGTTITYIHDPNSRRIAKLVNGTIVEKYLWSGLTTLLAVYDGNDNLLQRFEYADGRMPVAMTAGGNRYYLAYDQVGSLRLVTNSSGAVVKRIDYDTFGNILSDSNPAFTVPFGFAGGLHDRDTGLVRFGFRDYMPEIGRWTAKDPILFAAGDTNLYGYVGNDPVNWVDPWGLWSEHGEITNPPGFIEGIGDAVRTDMYTVINNPHPNARANTVLKYVSYVVGGGAGVAGFTKMAIRYPKAYLAGYDFFVSTLPGVPEQSLAGLGGVASVQFYEAYLAVKEFLDDCD